MSDLPLRISSGGIIINKGKICLTYEKKTKAWFIPKGKIEYGETEEQAARREILEETGLSDLTLIKKLGIFERISFYKNSFLNVHCFLFHTNQTELEPTDTEHSATWFDFKKAKEKLFFKEEKDFLEKHKKEILGE